MFANRYLLTHLFPRQGTILTTKSAFHLTRRFSCLGANFKFGDNRMDEVELEKRLTFQDTSNATYLDRIPVLDSDIPYTEFFEKFVMKNQPCIIQNISTNWKSAKEWVVQDLPNFPSLHCKYGDTPVSIVDCDVKQDYYSAKPIQWQMQNYLKYWEDYIKKGYPEDMPVYYLKDWHLMNQSPTDNFYKVPLHFASDWLNEYLVDYARDDYRFIYMGVKGTWSPFHVDVMTSYSWSSNICGQKRWVLFPPGEEEFLRDNNQNLPHDISNLKHNCKSFEVTQNPGDAIFVPSNWYHQVWNPKDAISVNHNWVNGCNLKNIWDKMEKNLVDVKNEIQDCADMDDFLEHCQVMLRASFGMNFTQFYEFLSHIAWKRIRLFRKGNAVELAENRTLGRYHALFDLQSIQHTLSLFSKHKDLEHLARIQNNETSPCTLLEEIKTTLEIHNKDKTLL